LDRLVFATSHLVPKLERGFAVFSAPTRNDNRASAFNFLLITCCNRTAAWPSDLIFRRIKRGMIRIIAVAIRLFAEGVRNPETQERIQAAFQARLSNPRRGSEPGPIAGRFG
jgi:hypothetical protein